MAAVTDALEDVVVAKVTVIVSVMEFCAALLSFAMTVIVFAPGESVIVRLQFAVPEPAAVSPLARMPFTVTDEIPLSPLPESVAVPKTVIELVETV